MQPRIRIFSALSLALLLCNGTAAAADTPATTVAAFYKKHLALHLSGVPTPQQLQAIAPYLSQHLQALLERAWQRHQSDAAQAPDGKPALADGDLFSSLFEGPTSFEILRSEALVHEYAVTVRFTHSAEGAHTKWEDVVRVVNQRGRPVIVDIEYGGDWAFAAEGTLVAALEAAVLAP